ncbi:3-oxoacyl-ACP synthase III family protein [Streptomyces violaceusniger]|uniref:3-oxoacyl-[acyl-carrier-protein] synthase 3 n=1 Tax=Streptomyces violaceusniger TaxID=68280 RepID=A0A4D4KSG4_STRVO|nr:3-oxoacyl-[acyl-carrier-protein] synthase 3 [Streptomyces violaceusniger]
MPVGILEIGAHVPDRVIGNGHISQWAEVPEEWVTERTGIKERRYASPDTATSDLAYEAVSELLSKRPGIEAEIGWLVVATATPDQPQPATAAVLQDRLGLDGAAAFDLNAVCSGFVYAVATGAGLLAANPAQRPYALVVGADKFSSVMDRSDRRTVSLFGDGAGAVLLGPVPDGYGIRASRLVSHGSLWPLIGVWAGGTRKPLTSRARRAGEHTLRMDGKAISRYMFSTLPEVIDDTLKESSLTLGEIDRFIFHQANTRLLEKVVAELGIDPVRVPTTAPEFGNTGAASIPLTLRAAHESRPIRRGERILVASVGGGMNAAAAVFIWH